MASRRFYVEIGTVHDADLGQMSIVGDLFGCPADAGQEAAAERALLTIVETLSYPPHVAFTADALDGHCRAGAPTEGGANTLLEQQMNAQINQIVGNHLSGIWWTTRTGSSRTR